MRSAQMIQNLVSTMYLVLSLGTVAHAQAASRLMDEKQELDVVIAALRAVVPEGLLTVELQWLCRSASLDPACHKTGASLNDRYDVGNFKWGRLFALLQLATGSTRIERVGLDRPRVQVERPWLSGDSVILAIRVRPGKQPAPGDTLTTLHEVVLGIAEGKIKTRAVRPLVNP